MSLNRAQEGTNEHPQITEESAAIETAIKSADGLILNDGPFRSLNEKGTLEIQDLRNLAAKIIDRAQEWSFVAKGHRVYYTCPFKFDCTVPPPDESLPMVEVFDREMFPAVGHLPTGTKNQLTELLCGVKAKFEEISNEELDARFKAFDDALIMQLLDFANKSELEDEWRDAVLIPLKYDTPQLMRPKATETDVAVLFNDFIIGPNKRIFRHAGLDVLYDTTPDIPFSRPDLIARSPKQSAPEPEFEPPNISVFGSPTHKTFLICEYKRRGLSKAIVNGEIVDSEQLETLLKQCLGYNISYRIDVALLSDFETSILLELNFPEEELNFPEEEDTRKRKLEDLPTGATKIQATEAANVARATRAEKGRAVRAEKTRATNDEKADRVVKAAYDEKAARAARAAERTARTERAAKEAVLKAARVAEEVKATGLVTEAVKPPRVEVPLRYRVIDIEDTPYTLQAVLASTVYKNLTADEESKKRSMKQVAALLRRVYPTS